MKTAKKQFPYQQKKINETGNIKKTTMKQHKNLFQGTSVTYPLAVSPPFLTFVCLFLLGSLPTPPFLLASLFSLLFTLPSSL